MQSRYEVYEDVDGLWRWRHVADNGEELSKSSEAYANKWNAERARDRAIELSAEEWEREEREPNGAPMPDPDILGGAFGRH